MATCDTAQLRRVRRERVAMVFQQFGLLPWRTVRDNVGFGLELRGEPAATRKSIVAEKLELVGPLAMGRSPRERALRAACSSASALPARSPPMPTYLLMDEPFSALDPLIRGKLQGELLALQERVKKTILFVSHDLDEALRLGDRITILQNGRIIQTGTAEDIVLAPADDYVAEFVRHMNPLDVLTGSMIMCERTRMTAEDGASGSTSGAATGCPWAAAARRSPCISTGSSRRLRHVRDEAALAAVEPGLRWCRPRSPCSPSSGCARPPGIPVLLAEEGRIVGVCGEAEIIRALAGSRH